MYVCYIPKFILYNKYNKFPVCVPNAIYYYTMPLVYTLRLIALQHST